MFISDNNPVGMGVGVGVCNFIIQKFLISARYLKQVKNNVRSKRIIESFPSKVHMTKLINMNEIVKNNILGKHSFDIITNV